jgi:hypothetical protein
MLHVIQQTPRPLKVRRENRESGGDGYPARAWQYEHDDTRRQKDEPRRDPNEAHVVRHQENVMGTFSLRSWTNPQRRSNTPACHLLLPTTAQAPCREQDLMASALFGFM